MPHIYDRQSAQELMEVVFQYERWSSALYRFVRNIVHRPKGRMFYKLGDRFTVESRRFGKAPSGFPPDSITTVGGFAIVPLEHGFQIYTPTAIFSDTPLLEITGVIGGLSGSWNLKDGSKILYSEDQEPYEFT